MTVSYDEQSPVFLAPVTQTFLVDPNLSDILDVGIDKVAVAGPTTGPNRYTQHVPTEHTVLSLGAASGKWTTDIGIVGYTDNHIHFETKTTDKTIVSLGGSATTTAIRGYQGKAPFSTVGYSMVTAGNAWLDSQLQYAVISRDEDVTLRTAAAAPEAKKGKEPEPKRAVVQADLGFVDLIGKEEVNIAGGGVSIAAATKIEIEDVGYAQPWKGEAPHSTAAKAGAAMTTIAAGLATVYNVVKGRRKILKDIKSGEIKGKPLILLSWAEWGADVVEGLNTIFEVKELVSKEEAPEASIKIDAENDVAGFSGMTASFFGLLSASLGSAWYTAVNGGVSAGMKATLFAGVCAMYTSVKGYKKVELGCDKGDIIFEGAKELSVAAEKGNFVAVGKKIAQVTSEGEMFVSGKTKVWAGTSVGGGWGMLFKADGIELGKAESPKSMKTATIKADRSIKFAEGSDPGITLTSGSTVMAHTKKGHDTKSDEIKFHAKDNDVRIGGKKILIDA